MKRLLFAALLLWASPACADVAEPVQLENAPDFLVGDKSTLTAEQRQANANAVQLMLTKARDERRPLVLPDGKIAVDATATRRQLWLWPGVELRSAGKTTIQFGPDTLGGPGFDHPNYAWFLLRIPARSGVVEIGAGITLQAPDTDPAQWVNVATPFGLVVDGLAVSGVKRRIVWRDARVLGAWNTGITMHGDAAGIVGRTELHLSDAEVEANQIGISAFGVEGKSVRIRDLILRSGLSGLYCHQGVEVDVDGADITVQRGTCVLDKGTRAVGAAPGSYANMRLKASGPGVTGMELDHFADRRISGVDFDSTLATGLRVRGRAQTVNCVFRCPQAFGGHAGGSGDRPMVQSVGDRFVGVSQIWGSVVMRNGWVRFVDSQVWPAPGAQLWSLPNGNADADTMRMEVIRLWVRGPVRSVIEARAGRWYVEGLVAPEGASHGTFFAGAEGAAALTVRGGEWPLEQTFYSGATEDAKARVVFVP